MLRVPGRATLAGAVAFAGLLASTLSAPAPVTAASTEHDVLNGPPLDLLDLARPVQLTHRPAGDHLVMLQRTPGLHPVTDDAGVHQLLDERGTERLRLLQPVVEDAHGARGSVAVSMEAATLTLHFDPAFLSSAAYPLTLEPAVERSTAPSLPRRPAALATSADIPPAPTAVPLGPGGQNGQGGRSAAYAWGANWFGVLGDGTTTDRSTPTPIANLGAVVALGAGGYHSLALQSDGTVWTWGANWDGELGRASNQTCWSGGTPASCGTTPRQVPGLNQVVAIAGGGYHSLALRRDGTVWAWGANWNGELGDDTTLDRATPVKVQGLSGVAAIAAGRYFSLALKTDGTVWAWGANESGELGDGAYQEAHTPVQVQGLSNVRQIAAGEYFALALRGDSSVLSWGDNAYGQLGHGSFGSGQPLPQLVTALSKVVQLGAGGYHGLAETQDGALWSWGGNWDGELGTTSTDNCVFQAVDNPCSTAPLQVSVPSVLHGTPSLKGAAWHSLVLGVDGSVWAWGGNWHGELGDGTTNGGSTPVEARGLSAMNLIAAGREHSLAAVSAVR